MFHLFFQTSCRTCIRREIGINESKTGIHRHLRILPSLACNFFPGNISRRSFQETPTETTFPASGAETGLKHTQQTAGWIEKWTKIGVCSAEKLHRNFAISRNFYTRSHVYSEKNSEKIGEWVG